MEIWNCKEFIVIVLFRRGIVLAGKLLAAECMAYKTLVATCVKNSSAMNANTKMGQMEGIWHFVVSVKGRTVQIVSSWKTVITVRVPYAASVISWKNVKVEIAI